MNARVLLTGALTIGLFAPAPARAQDADRPEPLPQGHVFEPLLADPKQPHFFAAWLWVTSPRLTGQVASIGLGEDVGLLRGRAKRWQVSVAAGVWSQFDMGTRSNDLINTDFRIGFPFAYRRGAFSARVQVYHQSSHLGDEFVLNTQPNRVNLSFEALEVLISGEVRGGSVRVYAGGENNFRREPGTLRPGLLHGGVEYRSGGTVVRLGSLGVGRALAALDLKSTEERKWRLGWSARFGIEFQPLGTKAPRRLSVQLQAYTGPAPYGQFYVENVKSVGLGLHFSL
jgi:opacity protein-like surface antigen